MSVSRRKFIGAGVAGAAAVTLGRTARAEAALMGSLDFRTLRNRTLRPVVVASANGIRGVAKAYEMISTGNADTLDAILAGVNIQELDPEDQSVGLGGLPNEDGIVQLDASCMHGPTKRAGAVAALEDIATASLVAKAVMEHTDHVLLVGAGAKKFALEMGFKEQNLLTEKSRQDWLKWRACLASNGGRLDQANPLAVKFTTGTIHMSALNAGGDISSVTTTSGRSWKLSGRVGDSAIPGAGQYCDNTVGAAGSTGRGEANIKVAGAFLIVELMRNGATPEEACLKATQRAIAMTERRLLDSNRRPLFDLSFYALSKDGRFGSASAYPGFNFAVADASGARLIDAAYLFKSSERPAFPPVSCRRS